MPIHPTAIIDPSSQVDSQADIGPYAVIGPQSKIGEGTKLHPFSRVEYAELGRNCEVYSNAVIGLPPQHTGDKGENCRVVIGDNCIFREGVTVNKGSSVGTKVTRIGSDCYLMTLAHVAHDCVLGNGVIMVNQSVLAGHVTVGEKTFISAMVAIHQYVNVGAFAMLSGGSRIPQDVAPFGTVQGDRATLRGLNLVGMRRGGISRESIKRIKEAYKSLFYSGLTVKEALRQPVFESSDENIQYLKEFARSSKRGLTRASTLEESEAEQKNEESLA